MNEPKKDMQITRLQIEKNPSYRDNNPDRWVGRVEYKSVSGNLEVLLAPEVAEKLLTLLGQVLVEFSRRAADNIAKDIEHQIAQLNAPPIEAA